ncbi:MAG: acetate kinase, partial [Pirellulaceae bacterium]|nr:acetate kinase [Pirellulaceae bacterium]
MSTLVINSGSTSVKASAVDIASGKQIVHLAVERLDSDQSRFRIDDGQWTACGRTHAEAIAGCLPLLLQKMPASDQISSVGHRVVHGGSEFTRPTLIDDSVIESLKQTIPLAPLHNPANISGIESARQLIGNVPHVAIFDTAFHSTISRRAHTYAIPVELASKHRLRRYGFHGTSHRYVAQSAADFLGDDIRHLRLITCHLGGGCSVCAVEYGRSVETSMGLTPLEGLVMGSRSGDIDPGVVLYLARNESMDAGQLDDLLNRQSGLAGLSGHGRDLRDIELNAEQGDERCQLAIQVFCHRLRKYIGAYAAVMGGVDAIVFTAGIGQNSAVVRHRVGQRLEFLGARIDEE